ncbi:hypothetical protein EGW08_018144 [Elysia chlorotica]|uniref:G-protein coupled receptors family 1 profile domain-containing protein n=1 Tax=Elysia chlorotica TaxID=188477 RepID=A0A3S0ZBT7_ELYCH|nr:hypothetical protein EGW08_018144 [Elysia chlorotica]
MYQNWFFGLEYCKIDFFIAPLTISVSVLTFMAIAIDRYIAIIHPLRPRLPGYVVLSIISVIWVLSFLLALPNLLFATTYRMEDGRLVCWLEWPDSSAQGHSKQDFAYHILLMILNYFLPIITLTATYVRIGWELWGSKVIGETVPMQADRVKSKRKVVKMMIAVVVIFGLCWLPTHIYFILTSILTDIVYWRYIQQVYLLIYWLAMSNSMYNPIIYCLMNARFRQGFLRFFRWCPCSVCRRQHHLLTPERGALYSARLSMGSNAGGLIDKNGSVQHTTLDSMDENTLSTYRMVPLRSVSTLSTRTGNNNYTHIGHRKL